MPWKLQLVPYSKRPKEVGDTWFAPELLDEARWPNLLSVEYARDHAGRREPLMVRLPGPVDVCVDQRVDDAGGRGWHVTGDPETLTMSPSVNVRGIYHGFVRDGIVTDDVEGRVFTPEGRTPPRSE